MEFNDYMGGLLVVLSFWVIVGVYVLVSRMKRVRDDMVLGGVDIGNISMRYEALLRDHKLWKEWFDLDREVLRLAVCQKESYLYDMLESVRERYNGKREKILNRVGNL